MSPYLLRLLLPQSCPSGWPAGWTNADFHRSVKADERYPTRNLPEVQAAMNREYWASVRADDAAEYRAECQAAAEYVA